MIATLVAALALAASNPAAPPEDAPIVLTFAWPGGAEATRTERAEAMGPIIGERWDQTVHVAVVRAGEEWRVVVRSAEVGADADHSITLVAGRDGGLRRLEGTERFRAAVLAQMRRGLPGVAGFDEGLEEFVSGLLEAEQQRWRDDVGRWAGKTLVPGETREDLRPAADARSIPARVRFGARKRLPCPGDASRECVELWTEEEPDEAARRRACASGDGLAKGGLVVTSSELVVIAESRTLLPLRSTGRSVSRSACEGGFMLGEATASHDRSYGWRSR